MEHDYKKVIQLIGCLLLVIVVCFGVDLIIISGSSAVDSSGNREAAASAVISAPEKAQLSETLSELLLCGQWPIIDTRLSEGRGNPFEPKKIQSRPLFISGIMDSITGQPNSSCLTVREVLNK